MQSEKLSEKNEQIPMNMSFFYRCRHFKKFIQSIRFSIESEWNNVFFSFLSLSHPLILSVHVCLWMCYWPFHSSLPPSLKRSRHRSHNIETRNLASWWQWNKQNTLQILADCYFIPTEMSTNVFINIRTHTQKETHTQMSTIHKQTLKQEAYVNVCSIQSIFYCQKSTK